MGLLDSLAQILPYAIPAAAGAALGGPGLGMVGAGGAAAAKAGALDQQMQLAQLMSESDYRNKELGLRGKEIDTNEALRKQQAAAEQVYRQEALGEKKGEFGQREEDRQQQVQMANQFHQDTQDFRTQMAGFNQMMAGEREEDKRNQMQQTQQSKMTAQIGRTESILKQGAKAAWAAQGPIATKFPKALGGKDYDEFEQKYVEQNMPNLLSKAGITPQAMKQAGFDDGAVGDAFPSYKPMTSASAATPAPAAPAPAAPAPAPAAAATPVPQVVNGRKVVQVPKSADYPTGLKYVN